MSKEETDTQGTAVKRTATVILWIIFAMLVAASVAVAQSPKKGAPAWTFASMKRQYQESAEAAGTNYNQIPIAYREHALRSELAFTGCLATYAILYPDRSPKALKAHCEDRNGQWMVWLNMAIQDTGGFEYAYFGQTAIALINVKRVHVVIRHTLRELTPEDAKNKLVLKKYIVPALIFQLAEAIALGEIPNPYPERPPS
jgi:hypothetical protein